MSGRTASSVIRRASAAALAAGLLLESIGSASADSEMHQSPELYRGSPDACDAISEGRSLRGGYPWRLGCDGSTPAGPARRPGAAGRGR